jgi:hypothetical protein
VLERAEGVAQPSLALEHKNIDVNKGDVLIWNIPKPRLQIALM